MFERYTARARRVILCAREEASVLGTGQIEPEALFLGLLRQDKALVDQFMMSAQPVEAIRARVALAAISDQPSIAAVDLPFSQSAKRVLACAAEESEHLGHYHVGTEHLLIGLLREEGTLAATILNGCGLSVRALRERYTPKNH